MCPLVNGLYYGCQLVAIFSVAGWASRRCTSRFLASQAFVATAVLMGCSPDLRAGWAEVRVTDIAPPHYHGAPGDALQDACQAWRLSARQVERFVQLSEPYQSNPYSAFYQLPCFVSGELQAEGKTWAFEINGGATATWRADGETRYWGCSVEECESLVLMPTDSMNPDGVSP